MKLLLSLAVAAMCGTGLFLMLQRDLIRIITGSFMLSSGVNLFLISAGLARGHAPLHPTESQTYSDPLVQALVLTAIVINFGIAKLSLILIYRFFTSHRSLDWCDLYAVEKRNATAGENNHEVPDAGSAAGD
jgi:multicomponent Na+:H+ antiporter subunit C